ncbi:hypothetical protein ES703_10885 [subsurface metagenome]
MGEGPLCEVEHTKPDVVASVRPAGHNLHTRRRAKRLGIAVLEPHTGSGQLVKHRRLIRCAAVTSQTLKPEVVSHYQDDVRTFGTGMDL